MRSQSEPEVKKNEKNHIKNEIIGIIQDAEKKNAGYLGFFSGSALQNEILSVDILDQADLPDLHFLQYIINELKKPENEKHPYKNTLLPTVEKYKKTLLIPHVNNLQKAAIGTFLIGMVLRPGVLCIFSAVGFLFSEMIVEWRLSRELKEQLALKFNHGKMAYLDHYDNSVGVLSRISDRGLNAIEKAVEYIPSIKKQG